jgi:two-component system chemotaxis sensor kinase CheA
MTQLDTELWALFRAEVIDALDALSRHLEALEERGLLADADAAFRTVHNVKGAARVAGIREIETAAHAMEDELAKARELGEVPDAEGRAHLRSGLERLYAALARAERTVGAQLSEVSVAAEDRTARIDGTRLDRLVALVGELLAANARLGARHDAIEDTVETLVGLGHKDATRRERMDDVIGRVRANKRELQRFGYLVSDIASAMHRARMLPLAGAVPAWRRVVVETAADLGRKIAFIADVGDLEIDRAILDALRDPIVHLLRNAVDHGVGSDADRAATGRPPEGEVSVTARASGASIELCVSDDGRGLDLDRIGRRAAERGVVEVSRLATLTVEELRELAFAPGVSTADFVTEVSGRGVGLDAVRRRLAEVGGTVDLAESELGGATFRLRVPATAVSTRGLVLRSGPHRYVCPVASVARTMRIRTDAVRSVDGASFAPDDGGEPLELRWLSSTMGLRRAPDGDRLVVAVLSDGEARLGLVVDDVEREIELLTKPLPAGLPKIPCIVGAMIHVDGSVAPVLDAGQIVRTSKATAGETVVRAAAKERLRVLVADDSLTSRTLERNVLTSAGYEVVTAVDGEKAWDALVSEPFHLLVSDVQMPKLDGLELTRRVRAHATLKRLPIVLVTSLDAPSDTEAGAAAGADAYVVKGRFDQRDLLETVAKLT